MSAVGGGWYTPAPRVLRFGVRRAQGFTGRAEDGRLYYRGRVWEGESRFMGRPDLREAPKRAELPPE